ncbi:MAG TPA: phosphopantetheine-binding protein [Candidatus Eisenbacteria bacterium]
MTASTINPEEIAAIYPQVAAIMSSALGCDPEKVRPDAALIDDLGAESIDFLDIVFRLEKTFKVKIPRGKIIADARGDLSESDFEKGGIVTEKGMECLRSYLSEVPAERIKTPLKVAEIPRLFTVETFCKIVLRQQRAMSEAGGSSPA